MNDFPVPKIDVRVLLALNDFRSMGDVALLDIASHADIVEFKAGKKLGERGLPGSLLYLLEGEVEMTVAGNPGQSIAAGGERAKLPLYRLYVPGTEIVCKRPSRLLRIDQDTFKKYYTDVQVDATSDIPGDDSHESGNLLFAEIRQLFHDRQINLPSLPDVVQQINKALQDPAIDFQQVAGFIQLDPVVAARILQVANSAMYRAGYPAETLNAAIARIGLEATRAIVMSVVMRNLFRPKADVIARRMQQWYETSIRVGVISQAIARRFKHFDPDHAFLAGLLHDLGVVPILIVAEGHSDMKHDAAALESAIKELRGPVGAMLLKQWDFDQDLITTAAEAQLWSRRGAKPADYCDIVQVALLHANLIGAGRIEAPALNELPAFSRLGLDQVDPGEGIKILQEAKLQISETVKLLLR